MKIFSSKQLQEADSLTIEKQQISSEELMERAATLMFKEIHRQINNSDIKIRIFCGVGNNGGDGLVIGRLLVEQGYNVQIYVVNYTQKRSKDFLVNYDRYKGVSKDWPVLLKSEADFPELNPQDLVVDAVFGMGISRPIEGWMASLVGHINKSGCFVVAIDMPSGLFGEKTPGKDEAVIKANFTLTIQNPKLTFFLPETAKYAGNVQVIDIGLDREYLEKTPATAQLVQQAEAASMYREREAFSHKGTYGHTALVGGSYGKIGSTVLAATAVMRSGAGMCTVFTPKCGYQILQISLPEAMVQTDKDEKILTDISLDFDADVICVGMGIGKAEKTRDAFKNLLEKTHKPMLIDADGLNLLSENKDFLKLVPEDSLLTPHPKEMERLIGKWKNDFDKLEKIQDFVKKYRLIVVLKGRNTISFKGHKMYVNSTGNPGMATAGSGDVLSGVIAGLLSQKYEPLKAAVLGVYLHGKAGDILAQQVGEENFLAGDIAGSLGLAYKDIFSSPGENAH